MVPIYGEHNILQPEISSVRKQKNAAAAMNLVGGEVLAAKIHLQNGWIIHKMVTAFIAKGINDKPDNVDNNFG